MILPSDQVKTGQWMMEYQPLKHLQLNYLSPSKTNIQNQPCSSAVESSVLLLKLLSVWRWLHNIFFAPLTAIHLYVNAEDQKNKLIQSSAFSCI